MIFLQSNFTDTQKKEKVGCVIETTVYYLYQTTNQKSSDLLAFKNKTDQNAIYVFPLLTVLIVLIKKEVANRNNGYIERDLGLIPLTIPIHSFKKMFQQKQLPIYRFIVRELKFGNECDCEDCSFFYKEHSREESRQLADQLFSVDAHTLESVGTVSYFTLGVAVHTYVEWGLGGYLVTNNSEAVADHLKEDLFLLFETATSHVVPQ